MKIKLSNQRVSSGIERLDPMLGGGFFCGASMLITCFSGRLALNPISDGSNKQ